MRPVQKSESISDYLKAKQEGEFIRVNLEWLKLNRSYDFDLYAYMKDQHILFCRKNLKLTKQMAIKLKKGNLFVRKDEKYNFQAYMEENISDIIKDARKPLEEKSEAVYTISHNLVNDLLNEPKAASINKVKDMVGHQLDYVMNNPGAVNSLMSITEHDYYTYTHSVNVAIYLVGLGQEMELSSEEIQNLSLGGMLHDLGKAKISLDIINSTGKLTEEQFKEMQQHPDFGVKLLKEIDAANNMVPTDCYFAISDHHEKFAGGGYPSCKCGKEIHLFGRMTKVCDVFDALTTKRSYKDAMTSFDSLKLMKDKMMSEFDPEIFDHFLKLMASYSEFNR